MPFKPRNLAVLFFQALVLSGALAIIPSLPDPTAIKTPILLIGLLGILPALAWKLRAGVHLLPALLLFVYLYARITPGPGHHAAALGLLASAAAFLLGIARVPLASTRLLLPVVLLCLGGSLHDLFTLAHLGAAPGHPGTSFFGDKHVMGGVLALGAFLHFHLMEKGGPHKPVQLLLYTSALFVLLAMVLCDSRAAQGAFLICFLPLLFLTIRLDGREPALERLGWIAGITLCLGLAWIHLPEAQLGRVASFLDPAQPGAVHWAWAAALDIFEAHPFLGSGVGGFQYAAVGHLETWTITGSPEILPTLSHARNHFFQVLAEGGAIAASLEVYLLLIALFGMAIIYLRDNRLQTKYAFFSLAVLSLMGLFTPVLDSAPLNVAYWAFIGYGWSFAVEALPHWVLPYRAGRTGRRRRDHRVAWSLLAVFAGLSLWHLAQRGRELRSVIVYQEAQAKAGVDPRTSTDLLAHAIALDPRNVEANYSYARVLAFFTQEEDAVERVGYVQSFAPDSLRESEVLAEIYGILGRHEKAAEQARRVLARFPDHLEANETLAESLRLMGACRDLEAFRLGAARLEAVYPSPPSREYIIASLDSLLLSNREINFLQRWFAGETLRRRFVERQLAAYNRRIQIHGRVKALRGTGCRGSEEKRDRDGTGRGPMPSPARLDGHPKAPRWNAPRTSRMG